MKPVSQFGHASPKEGAIATLNLYATTNYEKFKKIKGNRLVNRAHVRELISKIENNDLSQYFPILVNEDMGVIDGQHRIEALRTLGLPVYYEIKEGLNIDAVRGLNSGQKNWTWRDYATSYADEGNVHYIGFLSLADEFGFNFSTTAIFCSIQGSGRGGVMFNSGELNILDMEKVRTLLENYTDVCVVARTKSSRDLAKAFYTLSQMPNYSFNKIIEKLRNFDNPFGRCYTSSDFLFTLDEITRS